MDMDWYCGSVMLTTYIQYRFLAQVLLSSWSDSIPTQPRFLFVLSLGYRSITISEVLIFGRQM